MQLNYGNCAYSSDGIHWIKSEAYSLSNWNGANIGLVHGNGIWCAFTKAHKTKCHINASNSTEGWTDISGTNSDQIANVHAAAFDGNNFMVCVGDTYAFYTSVDGNNWDKVQNSDGILTKAPTILCGKNGTRICGCADDLRRSENNGKSWINLNESVSEGTTLKKLPNLLPDSQNWFGGCYADGYFYVITATARAARSRNGQLWELIPNFNTYSDAGYFNITYHNGKLYMVNTNGQYCYVGTFL